MSSLLCLTCASGAAAPRFRVEWLTRPPRVARMGRGSPPCRLTPRQSVEAARQPVLARCRSDRVTALAAAHIRKSGEVLERSADRIASDARVVSELARRRAWMGHELSRFAPPPRLKSHRDVTPVARSARPATAPDRPRRSQKGQLRITRTDAPPSHYPIGRIRKEKGGTRPRTGPPRGRHRVAVYSNSVSDSTSRTRSTCPEIGCLR